MPINCAPSSLSDCAAHVCVSKDSTNFSLQSLISASSVSERGNLYGPVNADTGTSFGVSGSTFESSDIDTDNVHWWEARFNKISSIRQIKIWACAGDLCKPEGKKLEKIRVDIKGNDSVIVASYFFYNDQGPVMDLILPFEIEGAAVRVSKIDGGKVLSISEVQVIGEH